MGDARDALGELEKAAGAGDPQAARRATIQLVAASQGLRSKRRKLARATGREAVGRLQDLRLAVPLRSGGAAW